MVLLISHTLAIATTTSQVIRDDARSFGVDVNKYQHQLLRKSMCVTII